MTRPIAVSLVAFDGHPPAVALERIARAGASHAEPAFISGTMAFTEANLSAEAAAGLRRAIERAGLGCLALSAHMDCGAPDAAARLERRLEFAAALGARFLITNTTAQERRAAFLATVAGLLPRAEILGVALAFENPGHGRTDLLARGTDAAALLDAIGSPWATLNYDVGNALTNSEGAVRPEIDLVPALPLARHLHLKDVARDETCWRYTAIGAGDIDYDTVFAQVAARPDLPVCIELPLRQVRARGMAPVRAEAAPELAAVFDLVAASVRRVRAGLG